MAMRMSGLISGLDTDSLIASLVSARRQKVTNMQGDKTKAGWTQDIWKDLNKDLTSLRTKAMNLRFTSDWTKKTTNVSNPAKASVITTDKAVNSVQSLKIIDLAKSGYLTGGKVKAVDGEGVATGEKVTALSKMSSLGYTGGSTTINIATGDKSTSFTFDENSSISDVLSALKGQGLNASFDEKNQRFFISSKTTGAESDFSITGADANGTKMLDALGISTYDKKTKTALQKEIQSYESFDVAGEALKRAQAAAESYKNLYNSMKTAEKSLADLREQREKLVAEDGTTPDGATESVDNTEKIAALDAQITEAESRFNDLTTQEGEARTNAIWSSDGITYDDETGMITSMGEISVDPGKQAELEEQITNEVAAKKAYAEQQLQAIKNGTVAGKAASKIPGQDAEIELNGAKFTNSNNVFEINGLTITALGETADDEEITLTTDTDTSGIYDQIKNLLKSYNDVIVKLDTYYNAASAKGYKPLTDEEKEALTDTEVEKYEKKIKDSLLKGNENLNRIISGMADAMRSGFDIGGKKMYLSSFGINTQAYLAAEYNTIHALHIDGDSDDEISSGNEDKLKAMIASDPETVTSFFTKLSQTLYGNLDKLSSRIANKRSFGTFYEDKTMENDYKAYDSKISELEEKANKYEDNLYAKFSKMEATMARLQSKSNAMAGYLGGGR